MLMTIEEFMNRFGYSDEYCEIVGLNPWCTNEGTASKSDKLEIDELQANKLGISSNEYEERKHK